MPLRADPRSENNWVAGVRDGTWVDLTQQQLDARRADDGSDAADSGAIVLGWITKLAVVTAVVGVIGFDAISVGLAHLSTADDAANAVQAASQNFESTHNLQLAYNAAVKTMKPSESLEVKGFAIQPDGTTSLTVTNTAHTLLLEHSSKTGKLAVVTASATGKYTGS